MIIGTEREKEMGYIGSQAERHAKMLSQFHSFIKNYVNPYSHMQTHPPMMQSRCKSVPVDSTFSYKFIYKKDKRQLRLLLFLLLQLPILLD